MLDEAIRAAPLSEWLTGMYKASILYDKNRQHLALDLEWRKTADMDRSSIDKVYASLVRELGRVQPEFLDDWRNVYRAWDGDSEKRILRINPVRWPGLSSRLDDGIKHRGTR
jgi:phenylacetate-CoA ligase